MSAAGVRGAHAETKLVRVPRDLAEKLAAVVWYHGGTIGAALDSIARQTVEEMFADLPAAVRRRAIERLEQAEMTGRDELTCPGRAEPQRGEADEPE